MPERGPSSFDESEKSRDTFGFTGLHFDNLYDEDETRAGDIIDPATGERYDNSSSDGLEFEAAGIHIVDTSDELHPDDWNDVLPILEELDPDELRELLLWAQEFRSEIDLPDDEDPLY